VNKLNEKKLMTIYVTKEQFDDIVSRYGKEVLPPKEVIEGAPVSTMRKSSPIGLNFTIKTK
jgi:hypothetical protein